MAAIQMWDVRVCHSQSRHHLLHVDDWHTSFRLRRLTKAVTVYSGYRDKEVAGSRIGRVSIRRQSPCGRGGLVHTGQPPARSSPLATAHINITLGQ